MRDICTNQEITSWWTTLKRDRWYDAIMEEVKWSSWRVVISFSKNPFDRSTLCEELNHHRSTTGIVNELCLNRHISIHCRKITKENVPHLKQLNRTRSHHCRFRTQPQKFMKSRRIKPRLTQLRPTSLKFVRIREWWDCLGHLPYRRT